jgi:transcriptional regulator with XRE-family HTH domain
MLKELGKTLRQARQERALSLQSAATPARISAPYLQKLERGSVTTPSPHVLGRLAAVLGIPYLRLLELAGYLDEAQLVTARERAPQPHPLAGVELSAEEWRAVGQFIRELKGSSAPKSRKKKGTRHD